MAYERINWQNEPSEATALNDVNLNKMDSAIYELDGKATTTETAITNLQDGKVDKVNGKGLSQVDNVTVTQHVAYGAVVSTIKTYKQDGTEVTSQVCNGINVDSALSDSSTNPVQNKVVKSAIDEKSTVAISDTLETGTTLANITIDGTTTAIKGSDIEVDEELSPTSTNPVENKAIYDALNNLLPSKTVSGNPIAISDASGFNAKALTVSMNPIQDLHGYDSPWAGGAGKNKLDVGSPRTNVNGNVTYVVKDDGTVTVNGQASSTNPSTMGFSFTLSAGTYTLSGCPSGGSDLTYRMDITGLTITAPLEYGNGVTFTLTQTETGTARIRLNTNYNAQNLVFKPMIEVGSTKTSYAPYSNICPISGRTEVSVTRTAGEDVETKTHQYSETIYGGVDDFVNGEGSKTWGIADLGDYTWTKQEAGGRWYFFTYVSNITNCKTYTSPRTQPLLCSQYKNFHNGEAYADLPEGAIYNASINNTPIIAIIDTRYTDATSFKTAMSGVQLCYELATPTTIETSAEEITLLKGNNVLSTNADDMELKYSVSLDSLLTT